MARLNISDELLLGLAALDRFLGQEHLHLDVLLVGANGMRCQNLISRGSRDLDNHNEMLPKVEEAVRKIANEQGLRPDWLNDDASDVPLPEGAASRAVPVETDYKNIAFTTLPRGDFIFMKVAAAVQRMEDDPRDVDDLREAGITLDEFEAALSYVRRYNDPGDAEFVAYQDGDIAELRRVLFEP